jgi:hypothetical protein
MRRALLAAAPAGLALLAFARPALARAESAADLALSADADNEKEAAAQAQAQARARAAERARSDEERALRRGARAAAALPRPLLHRTVTIKLSG